MSPIDSPSPQQWTTTFSFEYHFLQWKVAQGNNCTHNLWEMYKKKEESRSLCDCWVVFREQLSKRSRAEIKEMISDKQKTNHDGPIHTVCFSLINCATLFELLANLMKLCCSSSWAVALSSGFFTNILDKKSSRYGDTWRRQRRNKIKRLAPSN